ncbi:MAG: hypothetical protein ACRC7G_11770, partial [Beijerinckiaceae bacterium]
IVLAATVCALLATSAFVLPLRANNVQARQTIFTIADQDGYGTSECLEKPGGCGKLIADGFCESKGFKGSSFHRKADADDVTGSIASEKKTPVREHKVFVVGCR